MGTALWVQPEELGDYANTEFAQEACETASYLLWTMSGRKFSGETTVTERYTCTLRDNRLGSSSKTTSAILFGGDVYNIPSGDYEDYSELTADGMSPDSRIKLRGRPVTRVHTIRNKTGLILDPSQYYLVDHSTIHIVAGTPWTPCNTEITYSYGSLPPMAGRMAARILALEFAKLWAGDDDCALPQRITSVSRQGVSYTILDQQDFIQELRTGLYAVDLFIKSVNPDGARAKAKVFSPDTPRARRYTPKSPVYTVDAAKDIVVNRSVTGTITIPLTYIDAAYLVSEPNWVPSIVIRNWSQTKSNTLPASYVTVTNAATDTVTLTVPYTDALSILGMVEQGSYDLYATRPDLSNPTIDEVRLVTSGNLKISLTA
jgi:hypothetical protein